MKTVSLCSNQVKVEPDKTWSGAALRQHNQVKRMPTGFENKNIGAPKYMKMMNEQLWQTC